MPSSTKLFIKIFIGILLSGIIIALGVVIGAFTGLIDTTSDLNLEDSQLSFTSFVYYSDPKTGDDVEYERLYGDENRVWVDLADIPQHIQKAVIAIEDERFYSHSGFDPKSTSKAIYSYIFKGSSSRGASTITQQLIKNLTGDKDKSPVRKVQEIIRAVNLERKLSKDQILELYLNSIYLSQGCNGLGSASNFYFDKEVRDLTLAEAASIIGITQYPVKYDPISNPKNNKEKQELILKKMLELGYIDKPTHDSAVAQKLIFKAEAKKATNSKQSYFVDTIISDVLRDLQKQKGYSEPIATKMLYSGGLKIYATIDPVVQLAMDTVYKNNSSFPKAPTGAVQPESAMAIIDPYTGEVKGLVGGRGEKAGSRTLNRATQALRQPGSTIKPISVYAPAIENNLITPNSVYEDKKISYGNWSPKNYYNGFKGSVSVKYAIEISVNTVPVQILEKLGVNTSYNFLKNNLGISSLVEQDKNLGSLALGGLTNGVSALELAAAYSPFVNKGIYTKPVTYTKVVDSSGRVLLENKRVSSKAFSEQTASLMANMLKGVVDNGTGALAKFNSSYSIAGKTGTTDDDVDRWFVGFTPYYVGVVWFGYDTPRSMSFLGSNPTVPVWKKIMADIHTKKNLATKAFTQSSGVSLISYCIDSGKLSTDACANDYRGSRVRLDYFKSGTAPTSLCTLEHKEVEKTFKICSASNMIATEFCPPELIISLTTAPPNNSPCNVHGANQQNTTTTLEPSPTASPKPSALPKPSSVKAQ